MMKQIWKGFKFPMGAFFLYSPCGKFYKFGKINPDDKKIVWSETRYTGKSGKNGMPDMPNR